MTEGATAEFIETGFEHFGRFAFYTRDNPFVSSRAAFELRPKLAAELRALLDGEVDVEQWINSPSGKRMLATIKVGLVPRDVQLVPQGTDQIVGVKSVHAFFHAHLFWWLISILWTIEIGAATEGALGEGILGYRLEKAFLEDPRASGKMFTSKVRAHRIWREFPREVAKRNPNESLTTVSFDVRAFYYSVDAGPEEIQRAFFAGKGRRGPRSSHLPVLSRLLGIAHRRYAELCSDVRPREGDLGREGDLPLPVGLPSSRLLANMIMSLVLDGFEANASVLDVAAYADDLLLLTQTLPGMAEEPLDFLARLKITSEEEPDLLRARAAEGLAHFRLSAEKSGLSFTRHVPKEGAEELAGNALTLGEMLALAEDDWDPYLEDSDSPDWDGQLQTVLQAPLRRERVPWQLKRETVRLLESVRTGMTAAEAGRGFDRLIRRIDDSQLLAMRPYWSELLITGIAAHGIEAVRAMTTAIRRLVETTAPPEGSTSAGRRALRFGLVESWRQALAQALAVASTPEQRRSLVSRIPNLNLGRGNVYRMKSSVEFAMRIRRSRLIPATQVAVPLAEFTHWEGRLVGPDAFADFLAWHRDKFPNGNPTRLATSVKHSVRFIPLHEACLAIHLWAGRPSGDWLEQAFSILDAQPLTRSKLIEGLLARAKRAVSGSRRDRRQVRPEILMAMPSVKISKDQLEVELAGDRARLWEISKRSHSVLRKTMDAAADADVNFLVLPEWAVVGQHLARLMDAARKSQMMVIAGQAPEVSAGKYYNRLWTGIPLRDWANRRHCLVPPPRQKRFLSPKEEKLIEKKGIEKAAPTKGVDVYLWSGLRIASLICFEFADIGIRQDLRFRAEIVTVSSLNRDWHYFEVVQDSTTRDNYCLMVCVNTGAFPGTRITRPTSHEMAVAASVHGSDTPALITKRIDMGPIVAAQVHKRRPTADLKVAEPTDDVHLRNYKEFPPV
jgi:hypothetical protein